MSQLRIMSDERTRVGIELLGQLKRSLKQNETKPKYLLSEMFYGIVTMRSHFPSSDALTGISWSAD